MSASVKQQGGRASRYERGFDRSSAMKFVFSCENTRFGVDVNVDALVEALSFQRQHQYFDRQPGASSKSANLLVACVYGGRIGHA